MSHPWRVAWTIARRDYVAAVFSRIFVLFLLLPVILAGLALAFGALGARGAEPPRDRVAVAAAERPALVAARSRLGLRLGDDALPDIIAPGRDDAAVLSGGLDRPRLVLPPDAPDGLADRVALIVDQARASRALGAAAPPPVTLDIQRPHVGPSAEAYDEADGGGRVALAQGAQYAILVLTVMLAGRLLSSFIEERSNKVIEVLAAAVPVDAIFLGKLIAMLFFSLTCVAAWGATLLAGAAVLAPGLLHGIATPAVGWVAFVPLVFLYFASTYLLLGAVLLGLGAQASSPSDVQTLALPTTIAQLGVFALASIEVGRPDHWIAWTAAIFPWSSALAMAARAAETPALWPHLLAIVWQGAWLWLTVRLAAGRFRRAVLKSGPARRRSRARA